MFPRGWRGQKRFPIETCISLNGKKCKSKDLSTSGFLLQLDNPDSFQLNHGYSVELADEIKCECGAVRIETYGIGFAYRNLNRINKQKISQFIKKLETA